MRITIALAPVLALAACGTTPKAPPGTTFVSVGDRVKGHLTEDQPEECLQFEGLENAFFSATLRSDDRIARAPDLRLTDADGEEVDVVPNSVRTEGDAVLTVKGLVLPKTGRYTAHFLYPGNPVYYQFESDVRVIDRYRQTGFAGRGRFGGFTFTAPVGSQIRVEVRPAQGSSVRPYVLRIEGPTGAPRYDALSLASAREQRASVGQEGRVVTIAAARSGRYRAVFDARDATAGEFDMTIRIETPKRPTKKVFHDGKLCERPLYRR